MKRKTSYFYFINIIIMMMIKINYEHFNIFNCIKTIYNNCNHLSNLITFVSQWSKSNRNCVKHYLQVHSTWHCMKLNFIFLIFRAAWNCSYVELICLLHCSHLYICIHFSVLRKQQTSINLHSSFVIYTITKYIENIVLSYFFKLKLIVNVNYSILV